MTFKELVQSKLPTRLLGARIEKVERCQDLNAIRVYIAGVDPYLLLTAPELIEAKVHLSTPSEKWGKIVAEVMALELPPDPPAPDNEVQWCPPPWLAQVSADIGEIITDDPKTFRLIAKAGDRGIRAVFAKVEELSNKAFEESGRRPQLTTRLLERAAAEIEQAARKEMQDQLADPDIAEAIGFDGRMYPPPAEVSPDNKLVKMVKQLPPPCGRAPGACWCENPEILARADVIHVNQPGGVSGYGVGGMYRGRRILGVDRDLDVLQVAKTPLPNPLVDSGYRGIDRIGLTYIEWKADLAKVPDIQKQMEEVWARLMKRAYEVYFVPAEMLTVDGLSGARPTWNLDADLNKMVRIANVDVPPAGLESGAALKAEGVQGDVFFNADNGDVFSNADPMTIRLPTIRPPYYAVAVDRAVPGTERTAFRFHGDPYYVRAVERLEPIKEMPKLGLLARVKRFLDELKDTRYSPMPYRQAVATAEDLSDKIGDVLAQRAPQPTPDEFSGKCPHFKDVEYQGLKAWLPDAEINPRSAYYTVVRDPADCPHCLQDRIKKLRAGLQTALSALSSVSMFHRTEAVVSGTDEAVKILFADLTDHPRP